MSKIIFFTGAGLSAESGISTFRNNEDGLWTKYNPDIVANMETFHANREIVFKFYNERRLDLSNRKPNKGHLEIAKLQAELGSAVVRIVTQNIDNLLERAGCTDVLHVHGNLTEMKCLECDHVYDVGYSKVEITDTCPRCGSIHLKPNVVFFNEYAPKYFDMYNKVFGSEREEGDVIIAIGSTFEVIPFHAIMGNVSAPLSYNILCNKDRGGEIDQSYLHKIYYMKVSEAIDSIITTAKLQLGKTPKPLLMF